MKTMKMCQNAPVSIKNHEKRHLGTLENDLEKNETKKCNPTHGRIRKLQRQRRVQKFLGRVRVYFWHF